MSLDNWEVKKIEKLFDIGRGRVISENEINSNLGDYPVYSSQTANKGEFGRVNFYEFEGEYITWTTDGANAGTVFYRNGRFNCTNVCGTLRAKNINEVHTLFFSYLIDREAFKHVAVVGNNKLMNNVMGKIKLSYPKDYSEQKTIAAILSKVDEAIAAVEESIKSAEKVKKALMQNLLTGKLKPDGTWRSEDEFYTDEKFGKIPKGWEINRLKQMTILCQYGLNICAVDDGKIPMFRMNNIIEGKMVSNPMVYVNLSDNEFQKYKLEKGDILFNRTNSMDLVGKVGIFELEGEFVFASYLIRIRANTDNIPEYINYYLNSYQGQKNLRSKATPAVSQANINAKSL